MTFVAVVAGDRLSHPTTPSQTTTPLAPSSHCCWQVSGNWNLPLLSRLLIRERVKGRFVTDRAYGLWHYFHIYSLYIYRWCESQGTFEMKARMNVFFCLKILHLIHLLSMSERTYVFTVTPSASGLVEDMFMLLGEHKRRHRIRGMASVSWLLPHSLCVYISLCVRDYVCL